MSDYFGALMRSSGLAGSPGASLRSQPPSGATPDAHADIVELDAEHETDDRVSHPQQKRDPLPAGDAAPPFATSSAGTMPVPVPSLPEQPGRRAAIEIVSNTIVNSSDTASHDASRSNMIRTALEWVAADPHNIGTTPSTGSQIDSKDIEIEAAHAPGPPTDMTPVRTVRGAPPPAQPASRAQPASIAEDVVEISIGAIHVRVDGPAPTTAARIAPQEGAQSRPSPARPTTHSALSRRALHRI